MILAQHGILGFSTRYSEVSLVNSTQTNFTGTTTPSISVTAAADGNLMVITVSGTQTRTVTPPAGWSSQIMATGGGGTLVIIYRIASGESGTYNFTLSGNLTPGVGYYYEFSGVDQSNPFVGYGEFVNLSTGLSGTFPNYNMVVPGPVVTAARNDVGTSPVWTIDNGFTAFSTSSISRIAHRIYTNPAVNESTTWSGGSSTAEQLIVLFRAATT